MSHPSQWSCCFSRTLLFFNRALLHIRVLHSQYTVFCSSKKNKKNRALSTFVERRTQLIIRGGGRGKTIPRTRRIASAGLVRRLPSLSSTTMCGPFHGKTRQQHDAARRLVSERSSYC